MLFDVIISGILLNFTFNCLLLIHRSIIEILYVNLVFMTFLHSLGNSNNLFIESFELDFLHGQLSTTNNDSFTSHLPIFVFSFLFLALLHSLGTTIPDRSGDSR